MERSSSGNSTVATVHKQHEQAGRSAPARSTTPPALDLSMCELPAGAPSQLQFKLPVDAENKAVRLQLLQCGRPHMMAFHLSWICLFLTFTTTFAPAALLPVLQVRQARAVSG